MIIISHRGYWNNNNEKNSLEAFHRSFKKGFGTETDIRDYKGEIVISHDIPNGQNIFLKEFLEIYIQYKAFLPIAFNIKADGLQYKLKELLNYYKINNYFVFDMSVPDGIGYINENLTIFTRHSEYESSPAIYQLSNGVWIDQFNTNWIDEEVIEFHQYNKKKICIVSPELHKRPYINFWEELKKMNNKLDLSKVMLCTDHPEEARVFFND
jgi:glycerophosphoryl diester phosphodiesterase